MIAQHALVFQQQPDQLAADAVGTLLFDHGAADKVAVCRLPGNGPAQRRLQRAGGLVHVRAIQVHAGLEAQGIARAKPGRLDPGSQQLLPERGRFTRRQHDLKAVLAGIAGTGNEPVAGKGAKEGLQFARRLAGLGIEQPDDPVAGIRPLHGQHARAV